MKLYLIHGWGFGSPILAGLASELSALGETRLLALPGYEADRSETVMPDIEAYAEHVSRMIMPNSIIVGWSLGGMVALAAAKCCKSTRAVVLVASTPCFVKKSDWSHGIDSMLINDMCERLSSAPGQVMQDFLALTAMGDREPKETMRALRKQQKAMKADAKTLQDGLILLLKTDLRKALMELACPVIMLLGEEDRLVAKSTGLAAQAINPALHLELIPDTGHAPFISRSRETAERIRNGLSKAWS